MAHDWMLVETLGGEPAVVAEGAHTRNLLPISTVLRRNPHLMAIQTAISETVRARTGLSSITPKNDRVIRTEVVQMSDGDIHGVQIWVGAADVEPPPRPLVGPLLWDLTAGTATDTRESLEVGGWDPARQSTHGRAFADDLPRRDLNSNEATVLRMVIRPEPGVTICDTWDVTDFRGEQITVGFVARSMPEVAEDGTERLICRAMNWRSVREGPDLDGDVPSQRVLDKLARPGVYRALIDLRHWTLLKWLDEPAPLFDWRAGLAGERTVHPDDKGAMAAMAGEFADGTTSGVLRMVDRDGAWTPVHVSLHRVELDDGVHAGLAALREPTRDELAAAEMGGRGARVSRTRKSRSRKDNGKA
ncbi:hypothetical protein Mycch_4753 [Mycolicibacterium chubuense NBB4]|uniref:Rv3651-like N-terminal domain-containing protein n=1 Tax=Mycolicibacterium chubuense (strain NBB4) TaxID=710421 RepID=I4BQ96_MYCCN|nr:PAS domain-containing protein [Mycolicibacterium chubuense]AFM19453.1 hypothetical protein Mycch_4753 [Mycolicibacterium chubuense NBB4]